jgi:hypothetical protein
MKGTGHLVEDFAAPMALCPVDLRKMQVGKGRWTKGKRRWAVGR